MKFSQYDEEQVILEFFKDVPRGTLIDIGAYNPETFSNSRALINKGWSGLLVEASPRCFSTLMRSYHGNDRITLLNAFLSDSWGIVEFFDSEGAVATGDKSHFNQWNGVQKDFQKIFIPKMPAVCLTDIIKKADFVTIDCEGSDHLIVCSILWGTLKPYLICVEYGQHAAIIQKHLEAYGYKLHYANQANAFFKL